MLILLQDGESAFTLMEPFQIEIQPVYENPMDVFGLHREQSPKIRCWEVVLGQEDDFEVLGKYESLDEAKDAINCFTAAYEHDCKVFRVK